MISEDHPASFVTRLKHGLSPAWQVDEDHAWTRATLKDAEIPSQGWKLHISATLNSCDSVLTRALPVLHEREATFKVASTRPFLGALNRGDFGPSQIGKFITVYPRSDNEATILAEQLDVVTCGLEGVDVPSDRSYRPQSLVYYRYGSFDNSVLQLATGEVVPALHRPDGTLVEDKRLTSYHAVEWVSDPFRPDATDAVEPCDDSTEHDRYVRVAQIHRTSRSTVYFAIDTMELKRCVLKFAREPGSDHGPTVDERARLCNEALVLNDIAPSSTYPVLFDADLDGEHPFLVLQDLTGRTLAAHLAEAAASGRFDRQWIIDTAIGLCDSLQPLHESGWVHGDLSPQNILVAENGDVRVLDFELATRVGSARSPIPCGTPGYMSPQQSACASSSVQDDVFALGAIMYYAATGADPAFAPDTSNLLSRSLQLLRPSIDSSLASVIQTALAPTRSSRYESLSNLRTAFAPLAPQPDFTALDVSASARARAVSRYADLARALGDSLCATAKTDGQGTLYWTSDHPSALPIPHRTINLGAAGIVLSLVELVSSFQDPRHRETLDRASTWLGRSRPFPGDVVPGLYAGEAGVGLALLRAGEALNRPDLVDRATQISTDLAESKVEGPDVFNGLAGAVRLHLHVARATGNGNHLNHARCTSARILDMADRGADGTLRWVIPAGYGDLTGHAFAGYAHGAAGIADVLLELSAATGDPRLRDAAARAGRWIMSESVATLEDQSGLDWPSESGRASGGLWCHGAAGVGQFLLRATLVNLFDGARDATLKAARTAALAGRWATPVRCHGLAGCIEFLMDVYEHLDQGWCLDAAFDLAQIAQSFVVERDGLVMVLGDQPHRMTPDFMVGYSGVLATFLRLSDPDRYQRAI
jgi:serine/threonine protein kinase